ncbi:MAG: hypothetical protein ACOX2P_02940 [Bacillota bacterium]|jgi:hypothetical protein
MKKLALIVLLGLMLMVVAGCGAEMKDYVIKVDGTEGATFEGVMMYQVDTTPYPDKISGTVPAEFPVEAELISLELTKTSADGTVKVTLICNGEVVGEDEITEEGGTVKLNN